ncbi:MAG TPA: hypothetical protein VFM46_06815 [Pseudomonadales bacterium]|nr:hypothetical protein [Pseudomonadales bacterium]
MDRKFGARLYPKTGTFKVPNHENQQKFISNGVRLAEIRAD